MTIGDPVVSMRTGSSTDIELVVEKKVQGRNFPATTGCFHPNWCV